MPENDSNDITRSYVQLARGSIIGHYRIIEKIGSGGMGDVYLAEDTELNRRVALKFLPLHFCQDAECLARFRREAQAAAKLNHPNIVTIYEVSEYNGRPYFAMEHLEGQSLRELIKQKDIPLSQVIDVATQLCEGLQEAHSKGITHRDIKPSNVTCDGRGHCKILDFGLAAVQGSECLTKTGSTLGTVGYMSPEQVAGKAADARSDLFSLGVVLYEMLTGTNPFRRDNEAATLRAICDDRPDPVARRRPGISAELGRIVSKLLEKSPQERYQSATDSLSELQTLAKRSASADPKLPREPSVAVLPFANLSADPEQEYFCDGISEEIINALSHLENIRVIARTSAFVFKGKHEDVRDIGRQLGVEHLLEGSVRKVGKRLRITAQLIKASDGSHLWSERYDRELEDVFAIQDEISMAIVDRLKIKLLADEKSFLARKPVYNLEAYNLYLQGRYYWNKRTAAPLKRAIALFEQAIERDSNFVPPYAGIADSYIMLQQAGIMAATECLPKAKMMALKALEKDSMSAEAHATMGAIAFYQDWDWSKAESEFKRAIELSPGYATAHHWYANYLSFMKRTADSLDEIRKAHSLDPLSSIIRVTLATILFEDGDYTQAKEQCQEVLNMEPGFPIAHWVLGNIYEQQRMLDEAISEYLEFDAVFGPFGSSDLRVLRKRYRESGWLRYWQEHADLLTKYAAQRYVSGISLVTDYVRLNALDSAFEWLDKACQQHDPWLMWFRNNPIYYNLKSDSRYMGLFRKMGLNE